MSNDDISEEDIPQQGAGVFERLDVAEEKTELDKIFEQMLDPKNIEHFTEVNPAEITAFSTYGAYINGLCKKYGYKLQMPKEWIIKNLTMRVSKGRKGKMEMVKVTARNPWQEQQQGGGKGPWNMFRGQ